MKLKKRFEFKPKKVGLRHKKVREDQEKQARKIPHGARFGKRFFPYNKDGGQ